MSKAYMIETGNVPILSWCSPLEQEALVQARAAAMLPFVKQHVALMPDSHMGFGVPIGCVLPCEGVVIPNAVGVDIGCGMAAVAFEGLQASMFSRENLLSLKAAIEKAIPMGGGVRRPSRMLIDDIPSLHPYLDLPDEMDRSDYDDAILDVIEESIGTLGGGNHFVEIQADRVGGLWAMIHSGSRHVGQLVAKKYHAMAKEHGLNHGDLSGLEIDSRFGKEYLHYMDLALKFAELSRRLMSDAVIKEVLLMASAAGLDPIRANIQRYDIHHNYAEVIASGTVVHRKGATKALPGFYGIIPGSMGTSSYIVEGISDSEGGNLAESYYSCSHGAGRAMSRTAAKKSLDLDAEKAAMDSAGIVHSLDASTLDEAAGAYKDIDTVMKAQSDLVKIVRTLKPLVAMKGPEMKRR